MIENADLAVQLARVETMVTETHHRLFGNGQPGIVKNYEDRLNSLEGDRNFSRGFKWTVATALSLLTSGGVIELIRKGF